MEQPRWKPSAANVFDSLVFMDNHSLHCISRFDYMSRPTSKQDWILLVHQLPPKPTNLRVRTWRKLQKLGAVAIKNSVYVLPFNDKTYEDFQWLKQEIESAGGEATLFRAGAVEGATDDEITMAFRNARDEEYSQVTAELGGLTRAIREQKRGGHLYGSSSGSLINGPASHSSRMVKW